MILGSQNVRVQILGKALDALGVIDVKLQVVCIEVIALENGRWMGAKRLVYDGFNPVSRNDRLLRVSLNVSVGTSSSVITTTRLPAFACSSFSQRAP